MGIPQFENLDPSLQIATLATICGIMLIAGIRVWRYWFRRRRRKRILVIF